MSIKIRGDDGKEILGLTPDEKARWDMKQEKEDTLPKTFYKDNRIHHSLVVNEAMLLALLQRCGHSPETGATFSWYRTAVVIKWDTSVL
jgi:hypothetical protein